MRRRTHFGLWDRRHHIPADDGLKRRQHARRTGLPPLSMTFRLLPNPPLTSRQFDQRPHLFRGCVNRDRVRRLEDWLGDYRVDRKRTTPFQSRRNTGRGHHNTLEGAFAVPLLT